MESRGIVGGAGVEVPLLTASLNNHESATDSKHSAIVPILFTRKLPQTTFGEAKVSSADIGKMISCTEGNTAMHFG